MNAESLKPSRCRDATPALAPSSFAMIRTRSPQLRGQFIRPDLRAARSGSEAGRRCCGLAAFVRRVRRRRRDVLGHGRSRRAAIRGDRRRRRRGRHRRGSGAYTRRHVERRRRRLRIECGGAVRRACGRDVRSGGGHGRVLPQLLAVLQRRRYVLGMERRGRGGRASGAGCGRASFRFRRVVPHVRRVGSRQRGVVRAAERGRSQDIAAGVRRVDAAAAIAASVRRGGGEAQCFALFHGLLHPLDCPIVYPARSWGSDGYGQTDVPALATTGVVAVAAGYASTCALLTSHNLVW